MGRHGRNVHSETEERVPVRLENRQRVPGDTASPDRIPVSDMSRTTTTCGQSSIRALEPTVARRILGEQPLLIWAVLLGIFFLGTGLRLYDLDRDSLWLDEIFTATSVQMNLSSVVALMASGELGAGTDAPLMYMVTNLFVVLSGSSDFIVRFQAMLFGSLSILLAYKLGEILWTRGAGLMGAFLLAVNAYHIGYSQEARHYALMAFLALLSLIFLLKALQKNEKALWIAFVLCTSLSLYNHYFAFLFLPAEVIFGTVVIVENWLSQGRREDSPSGARARGALSAPARQGLMFYGSLALVGVTYIPWLSALQMSISTLVSPEVVSTSLPSLRSSLRFLYTVLTDFSGTQGATLLLWAILFLLGLTSSGWKRALLNLLWMGVPFVFVSLITSWHGVHPRYVLFTLPLYLLVTAKGIVYIVRLLAVHLPGIRGNREGLVPIMGVLAALVFASFSVALLSNYYTTQKADCRAVAEYLQSSMSQGEIVLADGREYHGGGDSRQVRSCLSYYLGSLGPKGTQVLSVERGLHASLRDVAGDHGQVSAVLWYPGRPSSWDSLNKIAVIDFNDVPVIRLHEPSGHVLQDTVSMLQALLELLPSEARFDVGLALAEIYLAMGEDAQAASQLELASIVRPESSEAHSDLGDAYLEQDRLEEAAAEYEIAIEFGLAPERHYRTLVEIYERLGRFREAVAGCEEILAMNPSSEWAHQRLEQLSSTMDEIRNPLWRRLGDAIALVGYDVHLASVRAGERLQISLWWQALDYISSDYSVFIHMVAPDGRIWAQDDSLLEHGGVLTSAWEVGQLVPGQYRLDVPLNAPPGEYSLYVGLYYWETGQRLPVGNDSGQGRTDDAVLLSSMTTRR